MSFFVHAPDFLMPVQKCLLIDSIFGISGQHCQSDGWEGEEGHGPLSPVPMPMLNALVQWQKALNFDHSSSSSQHYWL